MTEVVTISVLLQLQQSQIIAYKDRIFRSKDINEGSLIV